MEAPEKIWIAVYGKDLSYEWHSESEFEAKSSNDIEYIRTDVFIDEAWTWIEDNILSSNQQDKSRLYFEQFKKYMKGE